MIPTCGMAFAHRWAIPVSGRFASANRGPASKAARLLCHRQRFAAFPAMPAMPDMGGMM